MPLRETSERHEMIHRIVRPVKPPLGAAEDDLRQHAVHTAICWMHELTDASVGHLHDEFVGLNSSQTTIRPNRLNEVASEALEHLGNMSDHFSAADYASIYSHLQQGLTKQAEG